MGDILARGNDAKSVHEYMKQQGGVQLSTRYRVMVERPGYDANYFLCDMAYVPSKKIRAFQSMPSGSSSPIPIPFGVNYNSNLFEFIITESWESRTFFEKWQSDMFAEPGGSPSPTGTEVPEYKKSRANYYDSVAGRIRLEAISTRQNKVGEPLALYDLFGCIPIEMTPAKFDAMAFSTPMKFAVNIAYKYYRYYSQVR